MQQQLALSVPIWTHRIHFIFLSLWKTKNRLNTSLISLVAISANATETVTAANTLATNAQRSNGTPTIVKNMTIANGTASNFRTMTNATDATDATDKTKNGPEAAEIIKRSQVVCFDVDSTVIREEGIDELAKFCGKGQEVARLTKEAMKGSMTFQEALRLRLNIIRPSQKQIRDFLKAHPSTLSPGIK